MPNARLACASLLLLLATPLHAETRFRLTPGPAAVTLRAFGLGIVPIEGRFTRFQGFLALNASNPAYCTVTLQAEASSLAMPNQAMTEDALGPDLLDVQRFPDVQLEGACDKGRLEGTLTLHGTTRPISFELTPSPGVFRASTLIVRGEWGMGARPLMAGPEVRITLLAGVPATFYPAATPGR